jgi:hypothetical protein
MFMAAIESVDLESVLKGLEEVMGYFKLTLNTLTLLLLWSVPLEKIHVEYHDSNIYDIVNLSHE